LFRLILTVEEVWDFLPPDTTILPFCHFALSCFISAVLGEEIVYHGQSVDELKGTIVLTIIAITFLSILPLIFFTPKLIERRRLGLYQYGILAKQYVDRYHSKWVRDEQQAGEGLSAESVEMDPKAQDNFKAVGSMQVTVFDKNSIIAFAIAAAVPFAPLFLTIYKFDQLVDHILKKLF
jgi:hypothetical protein